MKGILLAVLAALCVPYCRALFKRWIRRGISPPGARFQAGWFLAVSGTLAVAGMALLAVAFKLGLVGMAVGWAGLGLLAGSMALGLMKLRK